MTKSSGVSKRRQNVLYFSVSPVPITAVHHSLLSPGSIVSWGHTELQLEIGVPMDKNYKLFPSKEGREEESHIPPFLCCLIRKETYVHICL